MVDPEVGRSGTTGGFPPHDPYASGAARTGSSSAGSPYGGWTTIGLGVAAGLVFAVIQTVVVLAFALERLKPGSMDGFEEAFAETARNGFVVAVATCATAFLCTGFVVLLASGRRALPVKDYLALKGVSLTRLMPWVLGVLVLVFLLDWLSTRAGRPVVPDIVLDIYRSAGYAPLLWFAIIVAAPVFEETFFRGFLFRGLQHSRIGSLGAVLLTSLIWAAVHLQYDLWDLGVILILGIFLGFARLKTGSLYVTITLHAVVNLIATIETVSVLRQETVGFGPRYFGM
jgi:membrane protease YdiL (CAAX protease family)